MADKLLPLMADAMINTYTPGQPQSGRNGGALEIVLDYKPNPKWNPPNTEAQALTGLEGRGGVGGKNPFGGRLGRANFPGVKSRVVPAGPIFICGQLGLKLTTLL